MPTDITDTRSSEARRNGRDEGSTHHNTPESELVHRLKSAIDDRGRYDFRLSDMSAGYAAARGTTTHAARREIEEHFKDHFGKTPHQYLEDRFSERRQGRGESGNAPSADKGRDEGYER